MSDADALLAAVLADPDADLPRLVYADWLDEHGEPERAEFIRVQIELARTPPRDVGPWNTRLVDLRARQQTLWAVHGEKWLAPLRAPGAPLDGLTASHGAFRRGFVEVVWMPTRRFLREADRLFRLVPVRELRVTEVTVPQLGELLGSPYLGRLAGLDLSDRHVGNTAVRMLTAVKASAALRVLRLRGCGLTDWWARDLAAVSFAWPLRELDVSSNPLSAAGLAALRERFGAAVRFDGG
jgi:uncharacterized protein (TIGR02996 family)